MKTQDIPAYFETLKIHLTLLPFNSLSLFDQRLSIFLTDSLRSPLDVGSVHTSSGDDTLIRLIIIVLVKFNSCNMLRMTTDSSAVH